jgi:hypothetical protein
VTLKFIHQALESFHLFLLLQDNRHNNRLKRPWARDHHSGLNMEFGSIEEPIKDDLILFSKRPLERCPPATLIFNELAKRRERLAHGIIL